jgi:YD repeat-containing protein
LWIYDPQGRRTSQTDPDGGVTGYTYDAAGDELTSTDPLGNTTSYTYDAAGDELTSTDPLGNTTTYTYDSAGRVLSEIDPLGRKTTSSYDAAGNKTSIDHRGGNVDGRDDDVHLRRGRPPGDNHRPAWPCHDKRVRQRGELDLDD